MTEKMTDEFEVNEEFDYESDQEFLEEMLGCDENWTLEDFYDSYDPD